MSNSFPYTQRSPKREGGTMENQHGETGIHHGDFPNAAQYPSIMHLYIFITPKARALRQVFSMTHAHGDWLSDLLGLCRLIEGSHVTSPMHGKTDILRFEQSNPPDVNATLEAQWSTHAGALQERVLQMISHFRIHQPLDMQNTHLRELVIWAADWLKHFDGLSVSEDIINPETLEMRPVLRVHKDRARIVQGRVSYSVPGALGFQLRDKLQWAVHTCRDFHLRINPQTRVIETNPSAWFTLKWYDAIRICTPMQVQVLEEDPAGLAQLATVNVPPGTALDWEIHAHMTQVVRVEQGTAVVRIDQLPPVTLQQGQQKIVPRGTRHRIENPSTTHDLQLASVYCKETKDKWEH